MKRYLLIVVSLATVLMFAFSTTALAGKKAKYKRCIKGCDMAKTQLLKACDKNQDANVRQKCRTLGVKKLKEECYSRCKKRSK